MSWFRKFVTRRLKIPSSKSSSDFSKMIVLKIVNNVALTTKLFKFVLEIVLVILPKIAIHNHPQIAFCIYLRNCLQNCPRICPWRDAQWAVLANYVRII